MNTHSRASLFLLLAAVGSLFAFACGSPASPVTPSTAAGSDAGAAVSSAAAPAATPATLPAPATTPGARPPFARDAEGVRVAIRSRTAGVAYCYADFSAGRAGVEGQVFMHLVVDPTGVVTTAEQGKAMTDAAAPAPNAVPARPVIEDAVLSGCIAKELRQLQFLSDSKGKETRVDYPIQLSSKRVAEGRI